MVRVSRNLSCRHLGFRSWRIREAAAYFAITFSPSQRFGLEVYFALDFMILVVEAESRAVVVNGFAWVEVDPPRPIDVENTHERLFAGFVEPDSIGGAILNFILPTYDKALTLQAAADRGRGRVRITSVLGEQ